MTQFEQGATEVTATLLVAVVYYGLSWKKCGDCDHKRLGWTAVTALGAITGVFIFVGCFQVMQVSVLNGVWSGIAGIMITLASATEIIKEFRSLSRTVEVSPTKNSTSEAASESTPNQPSS